MGRHYKWFLNGEHLTNDNKQIKIQRATFKMMLWSYLGGSWMSRHHISSFLLNLLTLPYHKWLLTGNILIFIK